MKILILTLLLASVLFSQIKLPKEPLKKNVVNVTYFRTINGGDEGFYKSISSDVSESGKLLIFDYGNLIARIYDQNGKLISTFGKEGSGPGEFNNEMTFHEINDRFAIFETFRRTLFFKHDGTFVCEIPESAYKNKLIYTENAIRLEYSKLDYGGRISKYLYKEFSSSGKLISLKENPEYNVGQRKKNSSNSLFDFAPSESIKKKYLEPKQLTQFAKGSIQFYKGLYRLEYITNDKVTSITKPYDRFKIQPQKKSKKMSVWREKMKQARLEISGGYQSDINGFIGNTDRFLFVRTSAHTKNELNCDLISNKLEYYGRFTIKEKAEISDAYIKNNRLYVHLKSDELGPFLNMYDLDVH